MQQASQREQMPVYLRQTLERCAGLPSPGQVHHDRGGLPLNSIHQCDDRPDERHDYQDHYRRDPEPKPEPGNIRPRGTNL